MSGTGTGAVLRETRRILEEKGRCKGRAHGDGGTICLDTAVHIAAEKSEAMYDLATDTLCLVIGEQFPDRAEAWDDGDWVLFNDDPGTGDEDVFGVLDKAIARAEEEAVT